MTAKAAVVIRFREDFRPVASCVDCDWSAGPTRDSASFLRSVQAHVRHSGHQVFADRISRTTYYTSGRAVQEVTP